MTFKHCNEFFLNIFVFLTVLFVYECAVKVSEQEYPLAYEAYDVAENIFTQGSNNYDLIKKRSSERLNLFLDLVSVLNYEMAKEVRSAIIKFYKIKYFKDFSNYVISMEEMVEITEHCLADTIERIDDIRNQFKAIINNFKDVRNFSYVDKCLDELPDEVAATHCILHQAVLFNETMQETLLSIVNIKTETHAQDVNASLYGVKSCFTDFVPYFFDQLLIDSYQDKSTYFKIINSTITDLIRGKWKKTTTQFPKKLAFLVDVIKHKKPQELLRENPLVLSVLAGDHY